MSRLVEVCLLLVAAGILCECERAKGKNSNKGRKTCKYFKNDSDHMQVLGNFTDNWKKCQQAKELLSAVKALSEKLQAILMVPVSSEYLQKREVQFVNMTLAYLESATRAKDVNQSTAQMCGMDFRVPDLCCKNIVDCSSKVTERLELFRGAMEKAQTKITTNPVRNGLVKTLESIKDTLGCQGANASKDQNSSVEIDHVCNTSDRFVNEDVAKDTLSFLSEELKKYLIALQDFKHLTGKHAKVRFQQKTEQGSRQPKKTPKKTSKPLD